jgi:Tfp pilus assembly protein PilF
VSLLLDALKRAEQEKQNAKGAERAAPADGARLAAANSPAAAPPSLELQPLAGPGAPPPRSEPAIAAQTLFNAKTPREEAARNRGAVWAGIGAVVTVVIAAGAYVWYSINVLTPPAPIAAARPRPAATAALPPQGADAAGASRRDVEAAPSRAIAVEPPASAAAAGAGFAVEAARVPSAAPSASPSVAPASAPATREESALRMLREQPPASPEPLRLARTADKPRVTAEVAAGYQALRGGDLAKARRDYAAAAAAEPANLDAQLGLATVEARSGNRAAAVLRYRKVLELDPRNPTALAAMASLEDLARPDALESQLRGDLSGSAASAGLHFTLGNLYAAQSRWNEAQAAYFEAHRLQPDSADIVHNLAVSLDQLGQGRLAADHYRRALEASRTQATQFDPAAVVRRLGELRR